MSVLDEKLALYYQRFGLQAEELPQGDIINPGAKTVSSLISKVKRNVEIFENKDFSLDKISDMARCSILFNSYKEIPSFLMQMKKLIPETTGYISRFDSGYRGIHLNFSISGVNVEVQLSTRDAWKVKQATELGYQKWRDFNQKEEMNQIMDLSKEIDRLYKESNPNNISPDVLNLIEEKQKILEEKKKNFKEKLAEMKDDNKASNELFEVLHNGEEKSDFYEVEEQIETMLYMFNVQNNSNEQVKLPKSLTKKFDVQNGAVDVQQVTEMASALYEISSLTQEILVQQVQKAKEIAQKQFGDAKLVDNKLFEKVMETSRVFDKTIDKRIDKDLQKKYINMLSYQKFRTIVDAFGEEKNPFGKEAKEILSSFVIDKMEKNQYEGSIYDIDKMVQNIKQREMDSFRGINV